jgi:hypothetical protein
MAMAFAYPEPEKGGRGKKALETSGFSRQRLGQARQVLRHSRELAMAVLGDTKKLDEALKDVITAQASGCQDNGATTPTAVMAGKFHGALAQVTAEEAESLLDWCEAPRWGFIFASKADSRAQGAERTPTGKTSLACPKLTLSAARFQVRPSGGTFRMSGLYGKRCQKFCGPLAASHRGKVRVAARVLPEWIAGF